MPARVAKAYYLLAVRGGPSIRPTASEAEVPDFTPCTAVAARTHENAVKVSTELVG